ncbi:nitrate reductase molybdenum cofactor assembly chaperone [Sporosarcina sp. P37]|uniref:nitrate reductase molybdenum cofactor assembly chaperone n=1 Tax=unclassified Sporosarcina TaxID=2647733 RepID=UPI0009BE2EBD|nr:MULTISPECIES: nitrate reductase molybdenum cofactor assembly chaperone [unclassified Sporosarcina]ARD49723.1 nitrate reductase [Sporosarcina sp. P33]ARK26287.1 nitrate reductase molybdenum cofactor assembly chaperone [Sporosarcina sp. P37]PID17520.1 nitrate reductase molybdenum cofactor assembly chaperone [Sporosarcina sp. P35]
MINLDLLYEKKQIFGFFSQQLNYPEKLTFHPDMWNEFVPDNAAAYDELQLYWETMQTYSLDEIQEMYTYTFDFQKDATLFMTYVKFEDSKERGQTLAQLKVLYEMFGLEMPDEELSDLLPLMCEFIYAAEWKGDPRAQHSFSMLLAVIEDGTYFLMKALEKYESPWVHLIRALRETCKSCIQREVSAND